MLHDAHFHYSKELIQQFQQNKIQGIMNVDSIEEYALALSLQEKIPNLTISVGVHPWKIDTISYQSLSHYFDSVHIIGEIGLDNVWCETDLDLQREVFQKQLAYASKHHKPVILHTKGMEKEIVETIKQYPNTYLVHWYSCEEHLQDYIDLNCYFTVGPSIGKDPTVDAVAKNVSLDHLLIETDGLSAIDWAFDRHIEPNDYIKVLNRSIQEIAKIKGIDVNQVEDQLKDNFQRFIRSE